VTGQQPFLIGTRSVQAALAALKKEPVEKKVSLPGLLLTRTRPDDVRRFKSELHTMLANDKP
jgi:ABC-type sugar transport system substrate-binding protein